MTQSCFRSFRVSLILFNHASLCLVSISQARYDPTERALYGTFVQYFVADTKFVAKAGVLLGFAAPESLHA